MSSITFDGVTKVFRDGTVAVRDLDLEVGDGELFVLLGASGSGKSTVLRTVAGLESVTEGRIFLGQDDVTDLGPPKRDVAMVFQNLALYPHFNDMTRGAIDTKDILYYLSLTAVALFLTWRSLEARRWR